MFVLNLDFTFKKITYLVFDCNYGGICSCANGGECNKNGSCICKIGYTGNTCTTGMIPNTDCI